MDLDKLAEDIKTSMIYVTKLKNENETLQNRISSLEQHSSTLESLLKEREQSLGDLLKQKDVNENNVLDKIISLQMDHRLKEEHKTLATEYSELQLRFDQTVLSHEELLKEVREVGEIRVREKEQEHVQEVEKLREQWEKREEELLEEVTKLKEEVVKIQMVTTEERTKVNCELFSVDVVVVLGIFIVQEQNFMLL